MLHYVGRASVFTFHPFTPAPQCKRFAFLAKNYLHVVNIYFNSCFSLVSSLGIISKKEKPLQIYFNPFAPRDFAKKRVLKLFEWFSGHCRAIKS